MVKTLLFSCALGSAVLYLGATFLDDTVRAVKTKQELRQARANQV